MRNPNFGGSLNKSLRLSSIVRPRTSKFLTDQIKPIFLSVLEEAPIVVRGRYSLLSHRAEQLFDENGYGTADSDVRVHRNDPVVRTITLALVWPRPFTSTPTEGVSGFLDLWW